jgi:hypothetical protein
MAVDISESSWKAFIKKQKLEGQLEDKELLKLLARFDKTDERKPEPRLEALADLIKEVPKQVTALAKVKKKIGDKPFGLVKDELYGILEEAEKLQKKTQAALDAEAAKDAKEDKADKGGDGDGEDEPGSALLDPKRLVAQLKMCQRTPDRTVQFAYLDPASKDQQAVLAMHPKMSSTSIFNKLKKETGGKAGAYGSAWVDDTSLMLQLDKPLGGLVKKVRGAVKAAGFRVTKVVLWQADGTVFEQDDTPDTDGDAPAAPGATAVPPAPPGPAAKTIPPAPPGGPAAKAAAPAPAPVSPESAAFMARLKALLAKAAEFGDPALAQQAKLLGSEAGIALRKGEAAKVEQLMKQAEALFANAKAAPATRAAEPSKSAEPKSDEDLAAAWQTRFDATEKVYLAVMARQPADAGKLQALMGFANGKAEAKQYASASQALDRLDGMLAAHMPGQPQPTVDEAMAGWTRERGAVLTMLQAETAKVAAARLPSSDRAVMELRAVMANLTERPATLAQVGELERYLGEDDVVNDVCEFTQNIRTPLLRALGALRTLLAV